MEKPFGVIYIIRNLVNGKIYIGQAVNFKQRIYSHKFESTQQKPECIIDCAIKKYGFDKFEYYIICECVDREDLDFKEEYFILLHKSRNREIGYNILPGGGVKSGKDNPMYGKHHSEESKQKNRESHIGLYDGENNPMFGKLHSEESKKLISESLIGKKHSEETKKLMSESHIGLQDGENNLQAKLTWGQVIDIRLQAYLDIPQKELAKKYKVSNAIISFIINNKSWYKEPKSSSDQ